MQEARWEALGTSVVVRLAEGDGPALGVARAAVARELAAIDHACSRFRADSELARVNAARGRATAIGPLLAEALALALRAAAVTGGDVDPTVGGALALAGYDRDWKLLEAPAGEPAPAPTRLRARRSQGWREVELDRERGLVRVPAGMRLDLGASAKAWAADRAASAAAAATEGPVLVAVGGDVAAAGRAHAEGWLVHVTDDHRAGAQAPGQTVRVHDGGIATSSTTVRRWRHGGHTMHHLIDPATGLPVADTWRTVSVAAATCAEANVAATAAIVRRAAAPAWLAELGLPARLVAGDGAVRRVAGWPEQAAEDLAA